MKIIRFVSHDRQIYRGIYDPKQPDQARIIQGDLLGMYEVTDKKASVLQILAPLDPCNILALGLNYRRHAEEIHLAPPDIPVIFMKATTSVIGPGTPILLPRIGPDQVDYEAELAVVIGKKVKNVGPEEALGCVFGYTIANDISARDWQIEKQKKQWVRGKSFDTFCPLGPCLVTVDEIADANRLAIRAQVNDRLLQDSTTADMIFSIPEIVSHLSQSLTLLPGTVILTGTPEGVGFTRKPPVFLREGDVVTIEVEGIGALTNPIQRE